MALHPHLLPAAVKDQGCRRYAPVLIVNVLPHVGQCFQSQADRPANALRIADRPGHVL